VSASKKGEVRKWKGGVSAPGGEGQGFQRGGGGRKKEKILLKWETVGCERGGRWVTKGTYERRQGGKTLTIDSQKRQQKKDPAKGRRRIPTKRLSFQKEDSGIIETKAIQARNDKRGEAIRTQEVAP